MRIVSEDAPRLELFSRLPEGRWRLTFASGLDKSLDLPAIGVKLSLTEVFDTADFADEPVICPGPSG